MPRTISLSTLNFLLVMFSLIAFIGLLAVLLFFGLDATQDAWYETQTRAVEREIEGRLQEIYADYGKLDEILLLNSLEDLIQQPTYLQVTDSERNLLFSYHRGERSVGRSRGPQYGQIENQKWNTVYKSDETVIAYYAFHLPTFSEVEANALLLSASRNVLIWALLIALVVAMLIASLFFIPLRKRSRELVDGLHQMANRQRDVVLKQSKVSEFADISEAAQTLQRNLLYEEQLRRQWAADIAHDLRSPVTVLKGQLEGIGDGVLSLDDQRISLLLEETEKLTYLINDLALLTHLESPGYAVKHVLVSVDAVLDTIFNHYEEQAKRKGMHFMHRKTGAIIHADQNLFSRMLDNLISNALRYGLSNSEIVVSVQQDGEGRAVNLVVENAGTIDEDFIPRLFDRLSRAESARTGEGTGLGLSIVKAIVEAHGWTIGVTSQKKTQFTVYFT
ncbi:MAG: sensor histidine kinase [Sphaerochaeta sp.]